MGLKATGYDEMVYARIAAKHFATQHRVLHVTPADVALGVPVIAAGYDRPFGNSSAVPAFFCAKMAHDQGITQLLAGDGGDELFGGNVRYARQKVLELYHSVPLSLRSRLIEPLLLGSSENMGGSLCYERWRAMSSRRELRCRGVPSSITN